MSKKISEAEFEVIKSEIKKGTPQKVIAEIIDRAPSTVFWAIRTLKEKDPSYAMRVAIGVKDVEEVDFSSLPDNVLFVHSKTYVI